MANPKKALVLGGTAAHIALINNLKSRNYYTILVDYYDNPPAKEYADKHIKESTLDKELVLQVAKEEKVDLVISTSIDQANVTACYVGEKLNLPIPYSYETALQVTNKVLMKNIMVENDIPTANPIGYSNLKDLLGKHLSYPLIVKPVDSNGSAGVRKVNNDKELLEGYEKAQKISRSKKVIVEEYKDGIEVSVDAFVQDGEVDIIMIRQKYKLPEINDIVLQSPGSFSPAFIGHKSRNNLKFIIEKICKSFGLTHTTLLIQALISDNEINIIEFAPRVGGGMSYKTVELNTGFNLVDATINSFLGIKKNYDFHFPKRCIITAIVYAESGIFESIVGVEKLIEANKILSFYPYKTKGMEIGDDMSTKSRIGAFLVSSKTYEGAIKKVFDAIQELEVFDDKGRHIMKKEIYDDIKYVKKVD